MRGIPRRYSHFVFSVIQSGLTSLIAAGIASLPAPSAMLFVQHWMVSWLIAWAAMLPVVLLAAGLLIFHFWPTQVPPMHIDVSHLSGFAWLKGIDAAGNACPSMHVAVATFTMLRLRHVWKRIDAPEFLRALNLVWCAAIIASTLLTKQHVVVDAICGALLGSIFAAASLRRTPAYERTARTA